MGLRKTEHIQTANRATGELHVAPDYVHLAHLPPPPPDCQSVTIPFERESPVTRSSGQIVVGLVKLARPKHWVKNSFVLAPLLCYPPVWTASNLLAIFVAFGCFCLWASSVYAFNDTMDRRKDAKHPTKHKRPVASGVVSPLLAIVFSISLSVTAIVAASLLLSPTFLFVGMLYLVNNLAYCLTLRNQVILDVMSIAAGFVLRIFAGCLAIGIMPSNWMIVCGFSLALLLGFGKRRLEIGRLLDNPDTGVPAKACRKTLNSYPIEFLNILLGVSSMMCLMSYMLYTIAPETIAIHGTPYLIYTTPFVVYGVFRYSIRCIKGGSDGPIEVFMQDKAFVINGIAWLSCVGLVLAWA